MRAACTRSCSRSCALRTVSVICEATRRPSNDSLRLWMSLSSCAVTRVTSTLEVIAPAARRRHVAYQTLAAEGQYLFGPPLGNSLG